MQRTLPSVVLFLFTVTAYSEVLIERSSITAQFTGEGTERTIRLKEIVVSDIDGPDGAAITTATIRGHKIYSVSRETTRVFVPTIRGIGTRNFTVVTQGVTETNDVQVLKIDGLLAKGLNTTLPVSNSRQLTRPRVMRGYAYRVERSGSEYRLAENTTTRKFSQSETRAANDAGENVDAILFRIIQRLEAAGYVDAL